METVTVTPHIYFKLSFLGVIDPQSTTVLLILLLILMVLSFVVAGAEVAFFSLTHKDINLLKKCLQQAAKRVIFLVLPKDQLLFYKLAGAWFLKD